MLPRTVRNPGAEITGGDKKRTKKGASQNERTGGGAPTRVEHARACGFEDGTEGSR
jgi:hypothetical protein